MHQQASKLRQPLRPTPSGIRMTYEQFLRTDGEEHYEWVDGELVMMAPVSDEHSDVSVFLIPLFKMFIEQRDLGKIRIEPFQMKAAPGLPGRSPDILFVARKNVHRLKKLYLDGPADLVVEIISPGSRGVDRGDKFFEYEKGGVKEYWLIDPERKQAEFYALGRDGIYKALPIERGVYRSAVLKGLFIKVDWLWRRPPLASVQREWKARDREA